MMLTITKSVVVTAAYYLAALMHLPCTWYVDIVVLVFLSFPMQGLSMSNFMYNICTGFEDRLAIRSLIMAYFSSLGFVTTYNSSLVTSKWPFKLYTCYEKRVREQAEQADFLLASKKYTMIIIK